jgi:hypothetical protein
VQPPDVGPRPWRKWDEITVRSAGTLRAASKEAALGAPVARQFFLLSRSFAHAAVN